MELRACGFEKQIERLLFRISQQAVALFARAAPVNFGLKPASCRRGAVDGVADPVRKAVASSEPEETIKLFLCRQRN